MHSAVKIEGERAYKRARRGEQFEMPERIVTVHRFEQLWREDDRAAFLIECSSGTYVRSLIADLHDAYCVELRRTAIGPFKVADAVPPPRRGQPGSRPSRSRSSVRSPCCDRGAGGRRARRASRLPAPPAEWPGSAAYRPPAHPPIGFRTVKITRLQMSSLASARVAVGTFDGVHLGHREVIPRLRQRAHVRTPPGLGASRHKHAPKLLTPLEVKAELIAALGARELIVIPFDAAFAAPQRAGVHR